MTGLVVANAALGALGGYVLRRTAESVVLAARRRLVDRLLRLRDHRAGPRRARRPDVPRHLRHHAAARGHHRLASWAWSPAASPWSRRVVLMGLLDLVLLGVTLGVFGLAGVVIGLVVPRINRAARRAQDASA